MSVLLELYVVDETLLPVGVSGTDQQRYDRLVLAVRQLGSRWDDIASDGYGVVQALESIDSRIGGRKFLPILAFNNSPSNVLGNEQDCPAFGYFDRAAATDLFLLLSRLTDGQIADLNKEHEFYATVYWKFRGAAEEATKRGHAVAVLHDAPSLKTLRGDSAENGQADVVAHYLENALGGAPRCVYKDYRQKDGSVIGTISRIAFPRRELTTSATFGLAHADWTDRNFPDRVEFVGAWNNETIEYSLVLAVIAREAIRQHTLPKPGVIFEDAIKAAALEGSSLAPLASRMPHALVLFPYLWDTGFDKCALQGHRVWFLQVVPLFDDEREHIERHGFAAFEEILTFEGARFVDLERLSHAGTH